MEPKKYYEYFYTWRMAEARRKEYERLGRIVCDKPMVTKADTKKKWAIWYNREKDPRIIPTSNARYYDK